VRVLVATDYYPPFIGGGQIQSRLLAGELDRRGHDVVVTTVWQNGRPGVETDDGVIVHRLRQLRTLPGLGRKRRQHHHPPFADPVTTLALRRLIKRFRPDVVHSYGWISYSCAAALTGMDTPLVIIARDYGYTCANRTLLRDGRDCSGPAVLKCMGCAGRNYGRPKGWIAALGVLAGRALLRRKTRAVHSVSAYVQEIMHRDFVGPGSRARTRVVSDVTVPPSEGAAEADLEARFLAQLPEEPFMLFIGALRRVKGVNELLAAYASLEDAPPLVLIGTVEPDSPTSFPPGVVVLQDLPHDAVLAACERCLFGVMPSVLAEPFGTVVCEVMSRGKPVIGTAPGGHADMIVDGETGFLVPRADVEALAEAMRVLASDPELRERLGAAARVRAGRFVPEVTLPQVERLYEEVLGV
jgi:glycosyltransferase involved in cell wall biosynthesis